MILWPLRAEITMFNHLAFLNLSLLISHTVFTLLTTHLHLKTKLELAQLRTIDKLPKTICISTYTVFPTTIFIF
ncbi:hypothetical protein F4859DRAFT_478308 [Xylaria cf. heliscus]|nr:hypothetical protein F4859DRAFT_478308 [Xylaria cf. heliscus]